MGERHKWADVAIAFAEGKAIQFKDSSEDWVTWCRPEQFPTFDLRNEYRIKPAEPVVRWQWIYKPAKPATHWHKSSLFFTDNEAFTYFEPTTERFKDEASRTEFPNE